MAGLTFNVIAGLYSLFQLRQREQAVDRKEGEGIVELKKIQRCVTYILGLFLPNLSFVLYQSWRLTRSFDRERNTTNLQLTSDLADLVIPTASLGIINFDEGVVGIAGTVSGLYGQWKKTA